MKYCFYLSLLTLLFGACEKKFDSPPYLVVNDGAQVSINNLKPRVGTTNTIYRFASGDTNLYCTVLADETSGNLYKQVFVRDEQGAALLLNLKESGGLYTGDNIRINLNGLYLVNANGMISLDTVDTEKSIVKLSSGNVVIAKAVSLSDILKFSAADDDGNLQAQLVEISGVEFDSASRAQPYGDVIGRNPVNRTLTNCSFQRLNVRTSGFSNFASKLTPTGNGKITGVLVQYQNTMQLIIRTDRDVRMNEPACTQSGTAPNTATYVLAAPLSSLFEQFDAASANENFSNANWINFNQVGSAFWKGDVAAPNYRCVKASSYNSGNLSNSIWLISQPIVFQSTMTFSFNSAFTYWDIGHAEALSAYVATNFNGKNFYDANWTKLSSLLYADGSGSQYTGPLGMKASGTLHLNTLDLLKGYTGTFCIAFRYYGTSYYNSSIYIDDVSVR